jgi:hypothetical protein
MNTLYHVLDTRNFHSRDKNIEFYEDTHTYKIISDTEHKYTSVTTWIHSLFSEFDADAIISKMISSKGWRDGHKYWGKTPQQIKELWEINRLEASHAGTQLHFLIECFMNNPSFSSDFVYSNQDLYNTYTKLPVSLTEWDYFIQFIHDFPHLIPFRTEWTVYYEEIQIAGSIDMVYQNTDGTLSIYDWKRAKNITKENTFYKFANHPAISYLPDTNYWHYVLQLNIYKHILQDKYGLVIKDLFLVRLHPDAENKTYELIELPDLSNIISILFEERKNGL